MVRSRPVTVPAAGAALALVLSGCAGAVGTAPAATATEAVAAEAVVAVAPVVPPAARGVAAGYLPPFSSVVSPVTVADLAASWRAGCPVGPQDLRSVSVSYVDFGGRPGTGSLVVHASVAEQVAVVFADLYAARYPIASLRPVEAFGGSDDASMDADNTSAFNCRATTGGTGFSEHSYGTAVDVNPVENPYVKGTTVLPAAGRAFTDRSPAPGVVRDGDAVVEAFARQGFGWGGHWNSLKDYQHFSISGD